MEALSLFVPKSHRPQILARVQALGLVYKESRARGGTDCTVLGDEAALTRLRESLDDFWSQVLALDIATSERKPLRHSVRAYVIGGLIALLAAIPLINWQMTSGSRQQDDINNSTKAWHCIVHYGDQSDC